MSRLIMRSVVVLPQPDGPSRTQVWPVAISSVRSMTALDPPAKPLLTFSSRITASLTVVEREQGVSARRRPLGQLGLGLAPRAAFRGCAAPAHEADRGRGGGRVRPVA